MVVEIGVWGGKSLVPMANALRANGSGKIYGIDPWDNQESIKEIMNEANLEFWNRADHSSILDKLKDGSAAIDSKNKLLYCAAHRNKRL